MNVSDAEYQGFAALLRSMVDTAGGDRIARHLVRSNPDALRVVPA